MGIESPVRGSVGWGLDFSLFPKKRHLFLVLFFYRTSHKERERKRVMNSLVPCDSIKSRLLAVRLLICPNLSHCNTALTWMPDREELAVIGAFEEQLAPRRQTDKRDVFAGAGGRPRPPTCLELELVSLSKKPMRGEFRAKKGRHRRSILCPPAPACPQLWLKVVYPWRA